MPDYVIKTGEREAFIAGLREMADFLTDNPGVLVPRQPSFALIVDAADVGTREEGVKRAAAPLGVPVVDMDEGYYEARRNFGPIAYGVIAIPPQERQ